MERWDWLGDVLPVDVANTVRRTGATYRDLWRDGGDVAEWCGHETGRVPELRAEEAGSRLADLRGVRDDVFAILLAVSEGEPHPPGAAGRLDALARAHPVADQLGGVPWTGTAEGADELIALVVHATIAFTAHPDAESLARCDAPSCGQFFLRARRNQQWCGTACGTRARVARHAAAVRRPPVRERGPGRPSGG